jgi:hypothetical protein
LAPTNLAKLRQQHQPLQEPWHLLASTSMDWPIWSKAVYSCHCRSSNHRSDHNQAHDSHHQLAHVAQMADRCRWVNTWFAIT